VLAVASKVVSYTAIVNHLGYSHTSRVCVHDRSSGSSRVFKLTCHRSADKKSYKDTSRITTVVDGLEGVPELIEPPGDAKSLMSPPDGCRNRDEPLTCNRA
jgi:hypothetical protein